jgi:hypothetical protein
LARPTRPTFSAHNSAFSAWLHCSAQYFVLRRNNRLGLFVVTTAISEKKTSKIMRETTVRETWNTKYGLRRVKHDPPTLAEAINAAKDMADDLQSQIEIAASLMGLPEEQVRPEVLKMRGSTIRPLQSIATGRGATQRTVVVERKTRRTVSGSRFG